MKLRLVDIISPERWKSVVTWLLKLLVRKLDNSSTYLEIYEIEQLIFRILSCPECSAVNQCIECGCSFTGRINNFSDHCSKNKWGAFFNTKEEWENYKKEYGLEFFMAAKFTSQEELRRIKNIINNYLI